MKVTLAAWAAMRYNPAPSKWVLRNWVRNGEFHPAPEIVGKTYYIDDKAERVTASTLPHGSLADRLEAA